MSKTCDVCGFQFTSNPPVCMKCRAWADRIRGTVWDAGTNTGNSYRSLWMNAERPVEEVLER